MPAKYFNSFFGLRTLLALLTMLAIGGCSTTALDSDSPSSGAEPVKKTNSARTLTPWDIASNNNSSSRNSTALPQRSAVRPWEHRQFPGKQPSTYTFVAIEAGRMSMQADSRQSASMLRQTLRIEPAQLGRLAFSWKAANLIAGADLNQRNGEDSPVRLVLVFEGDSSKKFSAKDAMLSELALTLTGEPLPYATLIYAWDNIHPAGSIFSNHRTDRIRKLVLESGPAKVGQWIDYDRDIRTDFEAAFGEAPGALLAVGIMTDTDNTKGTATAWYGPVKLINQPK